MRKKYYVVIKDNGKNQLHPMRKWVRSHLYCLPVGLKANDTSQQMRSILKKNGWIVEEQADKFLLYQPENIASTNETATPQTNTPIDEPNYWFVGGNWGGVDDQTPRFFSEGIWECGWKDEAYREAHSHDIMAMKKGDYIAVKSAFVQKNKLPFDNHGIYVSVMRIKAIGIILDNPWDGQKVKVKWTQLNPPREWYFYTHRRTIWKVKPGHWMADALIAFTFNGKDQDIDSFRNASFWRDRFGDVPEDSRKFRWTKFYEELANKLLAFRNNRADLIEGIREISRRRDIVGNLDDRYSDGTTGPLKDICPFTTIGLFNRGNTDENRRTIAKELAELLGVTEPIPESFEGIPVLHNLKSRFFGWQNKRQADDIDALWEVFAAAIKYADSSDSNERSVFIKAYDNANGRLCVGWNLTCGLYWIRPWIFLSMDNKSQLYITEHLKLKFECNGPKNRCNGSDYCTLMDELEERFETADCPVHSFPELSLAAWNYKADDKPSTPGDEDDTSGDNGSKCNLGNDISNLKPYSLDDIIVDGCFMERSELESILKRLESKKNIILQGPPGTGKTWLSKRLAYAFTGYKDNSKVRSIQFHPNLSYEDFVRGWRPSGEGKLNLVDGLFMEMIRFSQKYPGSKFIIVIEEINRGNTAQIFGEMLTLLEPDRRSPEYAIDLCYMNKGEESIYIPENLYIIGTMNIADRSLTLVDFALRRRFAFIDLEPNFGEKWREWLIAKYGMDSKIVDSIKNRMFDLNREIGDDQSLGKQCCIGHSYVTPIKTPSNAQEWFKSIVNTEIGPLLDEYWFDNPEKAQKLKQKLIENI